MNTKIYIGTTIGGRSGSLSFASPVNMATGAYVIHLDAGDFDGDGRPDLVVGKQNALIAFRNTGSVGSISFASAQTLLSLTGDGYAVATGDIDGDGKTDIVFSESSSPAKVTILRNTSPPGSLTFAPRVDAPAGTHGYNLRLADINNDGKLDVVISRQDAGVMSAFQNISTPGSVSLGTRQDYVTQAGGTPFGLDVADLDGDGKVDVLVGTDNQGKVEIFKNISPGGAINAGTFQSPVPFAMGGGTYGVLAADFDLDGKPDIASVDGGPKTVSIRRNTVGPGSVPVELDAVLDLVMDELGADTLYTLDPNPDSPNPVLPLVSGDEVGLPGGFLISTSPDTSVRVRVSLTLPAQLRCSSDTLLPNAQISFGPTSGFSYNEDLQIGHYVDPRFPFYDTTNAQSSSRVIFLGAHVRLPAVSPDNIWSGEIVCRVEGPTPADTASATIAVEVHNSSASIPVITSIMPDSGLVGTNVTISGTGFSATPSGNLVHFNGARAAVSSASPTSLVAAVPPGASYGRVFVSTGGNVAVSTKPFNVVFAGGVHPQFLAPLAVPAGSNPLSVAAGDFNGDGKVDLAAENYGDNTVSILLGDGTGSFAPGPTLPVGSQPYEIATADFSGDGVLDLVVTNSGSNTVSVLRGTGPGTFAPAAHYAAGTNPYGIGIGDFNRDGRLDVAVSDNFADSISILLGTGSGGFLPPVSYAAGNSPYGIAVSDFDNDGKADLAVVNYSSNDVSIFLGSGTGSFGAPVNYAVGVVPFRVVAGDWNADGATDLAVSNFAGGDVSVLLGTGAGTFGAAVQYPVVGAAQGIACADLNGDGRLDLAVAGYGSDSLAVLTGTGTGAFAPARKFPAGADPVGMTISDLNNDGRADLIVTDQAAASVAVLLNTVASSSIVSVRSGWNILSVPVRVADARRDAVFPAATSAAYRFNPSAGYQQRDTLAYGEGYWIKFDSVAQFGIPGAPRVADTFHVAQGWNMVGSISSAVPVASVQPQGTTILSSWYAYDSGYQPRDTLLPGRGYWVKVSQSGGLAVGVPAAAPPTDPATARSEEEHVLAHLSVVDAGGNKEELVIVPAGSDPARLERYELPPVPPEGAFDVRFVSGYGAAVIQKDIRTEFPVALSSPTYPVRIDWAGAEATVPVRLVVDGRQYSVAGTGGVTLQAPAHAIALIANPQLEVPATYALMQNYPNPFNPATTLRYGLPEQSHVRLKIYNLLGEEVKTLVDEVQEPGFKSVEWNSSDDLGRTVASGVYFYRLEAGSFVESKRMILLK